VRMQEWIHTGVQGWGVGACRRRSGGIWVC